ncbi:hypothetical protein [Agrobacterium tumefaciens]|uniref:hypothetical protein n=1 Tax=Rhizobium/Agrobacterium group TaxID=227290 RepID=UPI001B89FBB1|nr:hypothetical protein [Agrobacterium tumefaciens]
MMQVRKIVLTGTGVADAAINFAPGANVLAGQSDTGKSYLFHCLDYILGAEELKKRIPPAEPYSQLFVEFSNNENQSLTLERSLSGGDLAAHYCKIVEISEPGEKIPYRRSGANQTKDLTSVLLPFAGMNGDAKLRKNDRGETQRLTVRTLLPIFLVNEVAMIDEKSPVVGDGTFDATARKRMFAYLLSGKDDTGIIASEQRDIVRARNAAKLGLISDMLEPLERRVSQFGDDAEESVEKVEATINTLSQEMSQTSERRNQLLRDLQSETAELQRAETQVIAITEVLSRYKLLAERYRSDLARLDFIAEGAHYFGGLQEVRCPLCDQAMSPGHAHKAEENSVNIYEGARAEAAKIKALDIDLGETISTLDARLADWRKGEAESRTLIKGYEHQIDQSLTPTLTNLASRLEKLIARRVTLENVRNDRDQLQNLQLMKEEIERTTTGKGTSTSKWEPLPSVALRGLCKSIEEVLKDWSWSDEPRVEFDQSDFDIVVDGQSRQSHGKGVRSVLYSAFVIGLLRYCQSQGKPHPGFVVLDSPLTSYRRSPSRNQADGPIAASIEVAFWNSLAKLKSDTQIIIIENKEPPSEIARAINYEWFAGDTAQAGQRSGFIPQ